MLERGFLVGCGARLHAALVYGLRYRPRHEETPPYLTISGHLSAEDLPFMSSTGSEFFLYEPRLLLLHIIASYVCSALTITQHPLSTRRAVICVILLEPNSRADNYKGPL